MMSYFVAYICTAIIFLAIDFMWLGFVAKGFYFDQLGHLMRDQMNLPIAAVFYLVYAIGIVIFAVSPAFQSGQWVTAALYGALFGFFAYATYNITNITTLKDWPVLMSCVDIAWGSFITGSTAAIAFFLSRFILDKI